MRGTGECRSRTLHVCVTDTSLAKNGPWRRERGSQPTGGTTELSAAAHPIEGQMTDVGPFRFQQRSGKLDWRTLSQIDLDKVQRETDIDTLERNLSNVAFASVSKEGKWLHAGRPAWRDMPTALSHVLAASDAACAQTVSPVQTSTGSARPT